MTPIILLNTAFLIPNHSGLKQSHQAGTEMPEYVGYLFIALIIVLIFTVNRLSNK